MHKLEEILQKCTLARKFDEIYKIYKGTGKIMITLGNTGCDQDSFIGSCVLGLMENRVPVVNISRELFEYKEDLCYVTKQMGLSLDDLVFLETKGKDIFLVRGRDSISVKETEINAFLVDFSNPEEELLQNKNFHVERILDHRSIIEEERVFPHVQGMWIDLHAGSCCTLIFHYIQMYYKPEIDLNPGNYQFMFLLSIPILTDTSFLTERTHKLDISAIEGILKMTKVPIDKAKAIHSTIKKKEEAKCTGSTRIIIGMRNKKYLYPDKSKRSFGICSVKYGYNEWIERDGKERFLKEIEEFRKSRNYEFYIINSIANGKREFFIYAPPGNDFAQKILFDGKEVSKREINNDPELTLYETDTFFVGKMIIPKILEYLKDKKETADNS
ncbi:uncharacterized protein NESG_01400 [Nematocida ausubeli]|uniref:DHHA2 domain-containing protein n=1 Tax=Nematocida ausubeli (strain ATCC PRA-371 / ERTm2) TaxID=1913371 RepID=A0A086J2B2_NEMA1|nr:uncharacterized protein NESG_01400 [Nematocida ausubeli]KFG26280.1 hypothetical protein NESG_01400 [Nematocida ausubeli]